MTYQDTVIAAAKGQDLQNLLEHIAWTDVLRPELQKAKDILTKQLVDSTLSVQQAGQETREMIAGKLYGIDYMTKLIEKILKRGGDAKGTLAAAGITITAEL